MTKSLMIGLIIAAVFAIGSATAYSAGIEYLPSILMFVAAVATLGASMNAEDTLLAKYDTPHDEDTHPPQLIALRLARAIVLFAMGILIFWMVF